MAVAIVRAGAKDASGRRGLARRRAQTLLLDVGGTSGRTRKRRAGWRWANAGPWVSVDGFNSTGESVDGQDDMCHGLTGPANVGEEDGAMRVKVEA